MNRRAPSDDRKSYGRKRMALAIERAMTADSTAEQDKARRWAAAWGLLGGIRSPGVRLRRSSVLADRRRSPRGYYDEGETASPPAPERGDLHHHGHPY